MRDTNLLLTDANKTSSAFAANALNLDGTPAEGAWLQFVITKNGSDADERIEIEIFAKDTDASWATTDAEVGHLEPQGSGVAAGATIVKYVNVQTKLNYAKPRYVISGTTPDWTVVCSVVSGPDQKQTAVLS